MAALSDFETKVPIACGAASFVCYNFFGTSLALPGKAPMSSRQSAKVAFVSAVVLLLLCGIATMLAMSRYSSSAQWVNHTYEVQVATGKVESTLSDAARDRLSYITGGDPAYLQRYESAKKQVSQDLSSVRALTIDNPLQQDNFTRLETLANQRVSLLQSSIDARASGRPDAQLQTSVSLENTKLAADVAVAIAEMQKQEGLLLASRKKASSRLFVVVLFIFAVMLASAVVLLWIHYCFLNDELGKREEAENGARRLSVHVLKV